LHVTSVLFVPAPPLDTRNGLAGFVTVHVNGLVIHRIAVRRARDGRYLLSFPVQHDRRGRRNVVVHPLDAAAHAEIERQVIADLRRQGRLEP
jgi:DNA-binding cell septation regulator SpoVG